MATVNNGPMGGQNPQRRGMRGSMIGPRGAFAGGALIDTYLNVKMGDDLGTAVTKGAASGMLWAAAPGAMTAWTVASMAPSAYMGYQNWKRNKETWWNQAHLPNFGGGYQDTQRAMTMRQAAVQQIQGSKMNARSALGGEARILADNRRG